MKIPRQLRRYESLRKQPRATRQADSVRFSFSMPPFVDPLVLHVEFNRPVAHKEFVARFIFGGSGRGNWQTELPWSSVLGSYYLYLGADGIEDNSQDIAISVPSGLSTFEVAVEDWKTVGESARDSLRSCTIRSIHSVSGRTVPVTIFGETV